MPEIAVKEQIKKLVELQKLDAEIFEKKKELVDKPAMVQQLKEQFESKKGTLNELEAKAKTVVLGRKEQELELKGKEDQITKANATLNEMKTNREYTAKLSEIENLKADKSLIEEKILESFDASDAIVKEIEREKQVVAEEEKRYLAKKKEVDDEVKILDDRIKVLDSQRQQIAPHVDPKVLFKYEAILNNKQGLALVAVTGNNSCGGCFMNLRVQNINAIKMAEEMFQCEYCSRILYLEEDL